MEIEQSSDGGAAGLRILLVSSLFAPEVGGVCAVAEALAANLPEHIVVAAARTPGRLVVDWPQYDRRFSFKIHRVAAFEAELPKSLPGGLRGAFQFAYNFVWTRRRTAASLNRLLAANPVDVVCINTLGSYWVAAALKRRYPGIKIIFYLHGEEVGGGPNPRRIDRLRNQALQAADAVVTVSSFTRERALRCGVAEGKLHIIHNGVDTVRFTPGLKDVTIEERFGLGGKKVLLCLARLDERKGQDRLIAAMAAIQAAVPDAVLLLVGAGAHEERLRTLTERLGLRDCVVFAGSAAESEVVAFYRTADVYAMPNREMESGDTEGFGLVFLEAGACAKPVLGGRAGGVPDAILEGKTGYLVDGRSSAEIAEACIRLLTDTELAVAMGQEGLLHSSRNTWKCQAARFLALCESVCHTDGKPVEESR